MSCYLNLNLCVLQCAYSGVGSGCKGSYPFNSPDPRLLPVAAKGEVCSPYTAVCGPSLCCSQVRWLTCKPAYDCPGCSTDGSPSILGVADRTGCLGKTAQQRLRVCLLGAVCLLSHGYIRGKDLLGFGGGGSQRQVLLEKRTWAIEEWMNASQQQATCAASNPRAVYVAYTNDKLATAAACYTTAVWHMLARYRCVLVSLTCQTEGYFEAK